jgi:TetR/AcrR family transcriptional regulator
MSDVTASRRQQRRQQHHDLSRSQLLDAAEEVFGRRGFHGTTLKEIAELAEFSVGSVYSFFSSKEDLFQQIFLRRGEDFMPGMRSAAAGGASARQALSDLVDYQIRVFREHPPFGRLYLRVTGGAPMSADGREDEVATADMAMAANYAEAMQLQADLFRRGQESGEFRAGDPAVLSRLLSGLVAAYQGVDPMIMSDDPAAEERLPLEDLHDLVQRAFAAT